MSQQSFVSFNGKTLTEEQCSILEQAATGKSLIINAFAGTGKTFTLRALASKPLADKKGLYLAFNRKIVDDATTVFPVKCIMSDYSFSCIQRYWCELRQGWTHEAVSQCFDIVR